MEPIAGASTEKAKTQTVSTQRRPALSVSAPSIMSQSPAGEIWVSWAAVSSQTGFSIIAGMAAPGTTMSKPSSSTAIQSRVTTSPVPRRRRLPAAVCDAAVMFLVLMNP